MSPAVPLPGADATGPRGSASQGSAQRSVAAARALPGGRVVTVATLLVVAVALLEVASEARISTWTSATLLAVSAAAALVTRRGDRSLPIIMPPLAFLAAAACAGQGLVEGSGWSSQSIMLVDVLGGNASWVVAATAVAVLVVAIRRVIGR